MVNLRNAAYAVLATVLAPCSVQSQQRPDPATVLAAQREAMAPLSFMDGVWRGAAWTLLPTGEKHSITQTERVGPFLEGTIKVIEGCGYDSTGQVVFNAFGTISYNPSTRAYTMHSYAQGNVGDFVLTPTANGFVWEIPAGPTIIRFTAVIKDGTWHEVGDRIVPGKEPIRFFEMTLLRLGDTEWPAGSPVLPR